MTLNKIFITVLKSCLHIALYIALGLLLALFINSTAQAAEIDYTENPPNTIEETGIEETEFENTDPSATPVADPPGALLVHSRTDGTNIALGGTVIMVYRAFDNSVVAELVTDIYGEAMTELPAGDYYLRKTAVPFGYILNTDRVNFNLRPGELIELVVFSKAEPVVTPPPAINPGRLVIVNKTEGTGENLSGSVFVLFDAMNDYFIAEITTNQFGEVSYNLPAGDYYLRQISVIQDYILNTNRIGFNIRPDEVRSVTVTNKIQPIPTPPPAEQPGRLVVTKLSEGTRERLQGAVFGVFNVANDIKAAEIITDHYGEAAVSLNAGDYYLRELAAPNGFILNVDKIGVKIKAGQITEITVTNKPEPVTSQPASQPGRLLLTVQAERTNEKLKGIVFEVHEALTDTIIGWLTTDQYGEISVELPAGDYSMRQLSTPDGFIINTNRIPIRIREGAVTEMTVTRTAVPMPTPEPTPAPIPAPSSTTNPASGTTPPSVIEATPDKNQGRIEIVTRAAGSGNLLSGGVYAVYSTSDNRRVAEVTIGVGGKTELTVEPGMYYIRELRPTFGYLLETERIFLEISTGKTVVMELTKERDWNITDLPADSENGGIIFIPQTGQIYPVMYYVVGGLMMVAAFVFGGLAIWGFIKKKPSKEVLNCG